FVKKATELGADVKVQDANSDDVRQVADVQTLITLGVDVIVIAPHNGDAMAKAVRMAREAGIPVLAYDRLIRNCDLDLYMTFDNLRLGELQGQFIADALPRFAGRKMRHPSLRREDRQQRRRLQARPGQGPGAIHQERCDRS